MQDLELRLGGRMKGIGRPIRHEKIMKELHEIRAETASAERHSGSKVARFAERERWAKGKSCKRIRGGLARTRVVKNAKAGVQLLSNLLWLEQITTCRPRKNEKIQELSSVLRRIAARRSREREQASSGRDSKRFPPRQLPMKERSSGTETKQKYRPSDSTLRARRILKSKDDRSRN
jgi:hypothetical protein